jgi:exodeoxyribonuclease VII large subunit
VPITVTQLTRGIKALLDGASDLRDVWVAGEVSNCKLHTSGHMYFTLKDAGATLRCVMFRSRVQHLRFRPDNGMAVVVRGAVSVYERDGAYQLYAEEMAPAGLGSLHQAYERLKARLAAEGLFADADKRPLPRLPRGVALVTSPTGAALQDMVRVARRRCPGVPLVLVPALVQGADAPASIVQALGWAGRLDVDVVILARGGGSLEELWAFNDELVARAIRACPLPVVAGVGHETDVTIADFAADRRAPTPSAAAEVVLPDRDALRSDIDALRQAALQAMRSRLRGLRLRLEAARRGPLRRPEAAFAPQRAQLRHATLRLESAGRGVHQRAAARWRAEAARLEALSPLAVLGRGFAVCRTPEGTVVRRPEQAPAGSAIEVLLQEGSLAARVESHGHGIGERA